MRSLALFLLLYLGMHAGTETPVLIRLPMESLSPSVRDKVQRCQADIQAALDLRSLPYAKPGRPVYNPDGSPDKNEKGETNYSFGISDGGTTFWHGDGYILTVWHMWWAIGGVDGRLAGVTVELSKDITGHDRVPPLVPPLSFVRFIANSETELNQSSTAQRP